MTNKQDCILSVLEKSLPILSGASLPVPGVSVDSNWLLRIYDAVLGSTLSVDGLIPIHVHSSIDEDIRSFEAYVQSLCPCAHLRSALSYFISELICNVEQHAGVELGFAWARYDVASRRLVLGIADGGVSIYGSYVRAQQYLEEVGDSDAQALYLAQNGYSTKNLPGAENRGYGISSNSRLIVDGLGGSFAILSGSALFHHAEGGKRIFALPDSVVWPGTLVLAEIPVEERAFDLYDYIG